MKIITHPLCCREIGAPADMRDGSCAPLPVAIETNVYGTWLVSFWQPDVDELTTLNAGGGITLQVRSLQHPVVALGVYTALDAPAPAQPAPASATDMLALRAAFEDAALSHAIQQRIAGRVTGDDNSADFTRESLFWRKPSGDYGVAQFNAAWWGYQMAAKGGA
jgi:hypothetical protein